MGYFNPRTPRGVRLKATFCPAATCYFNPRTPRGVRLKTAVLCGVYQKFQSTHPARGATALLLGLFLCSSDFNPRTPRGVRRLTAYPAHRLDVISIHAPREGCDLNASTRLSGDLAISIHAPREGCDPVSRVIVTEHAYFNPRTPRGVRLFVVGQHVPLTIISIHAPREGCDISQNIPACHTNHFNPRTPRGVRPLHQWCINRPAKISIHAPREGCDYCKAYCVEVENRFQSTHPARGATANFTKEQGVCLAQFAYLHKGKKAEHTKTNAPMLH